MTTPEPPIEDVREAAIERLRKKQDFHAHLVVYVLVNALLWAVWATTGSGFPWPVFPTAGWGIGLFFNGWDTYWRHPITERDVEREIQRLQGA